MADPIVKIKRKSNGSIRPTGMSEGELALNFSSGSFYIVNGSGSAITFGSEIDSSATLSSNSDNKIATQYAVKTFVDSSNTSNGLQSLLRTTSGTLNIPHITDTIIPFGTEIFNTISGLVYSGGTFINTSGITMCLHISYSVPLTYSIGGSNLGSIHTWIQTDGEPSKSKYGASYESNENISIYNFQTNSGSFIIPIAPSVGFSICCAWQGGTAGSPVVSASISSGNEDTKAKVSIFKF